MAARQRTPRKERAVFPYRVATARSGAVPRPLQAGPQALDAVAIVVDRRWAGDGRLFDLGRDGGPCAEAPDALAEGAAAVATVRHDPHRHIGQSGEQRDSVGQFVRLARREGKGNRPSRAVGDHAGSEACL